LPEGFVDIKDLN